MDNDRHQGPHRRGEQPSVLFINRVYPPVAGATGDVLAELAAGLVAQGWAVSVLTGAPLGQVGSIKMENGVRLERVRTRGFARTRVWQRALAYLLLYPSFLYRALRHGPVDVIVTKTDPPLQLILGMILKGVWRCRVVHWAQDLYPEVAEQLGVIRPRGTRARLCRGISNWALRAHDEVVVIGRCMRERLEQRGVPPAKIRVIPNWPMGAIHPTSHADNPFRAAHGLDDRFVVMYSGNMGLAHCFEAVLDAAEQLEGRASDVLFLFVGDGPRRVGLEAEVQRRRLGNVRFLPFQPKHTLSHSLSAADLHLVSMRDVLCGLVVPSKIYGVFAAGRPCLFLGPAKSEAARIIQEVECGEVLEDATGDHLADRIEAWRHDAAGRKAAGVAGRRSFHRAPGQAFQAFDAVLGGARMDAKPRAKVEEAAGVQPVAHYS